MAITERVVVQVARDNQPIVINNLSPMAKVVQVSHAAEGTVVEFLRGKPGLNNVYVGTTPPVGAQENWIWIDTS